MEHRRRRRKDVRPQFGVDAVGADHDVGLGDRAVREAHARHVAGLLEADGAVAGAHDALRQAGGEKVD